MLNTIFQFMGYTFAFWLMWKLFDKVYHHLRGDAKTGCDFCDRREREVKNLKRINQEQKDKYHPRELNALEMEMIRKDKEELLAIKILNVAGEGTLEDIYRIGPVKTRRIMESRPFYSWHDVEKTIPGFKRYIISWAKKWEKSFASRLR